MTTERHGADVVRAKGKVEPSGDERWLYVRGLADLDGRAVKLRAPTLRDRAGGRGPPIGGQWPGPLLECDGPVENGAVRFSLGKLSTRGLDLDCLELVVSPPGRRLLVALGCSDYDHDHDMNLILVPEGLKRVEHLFCGGDTRPGLDYERCDLGLPDSPTEADVKRALRGWVEQTTPGRDDVVAIWISCHGVVDEVTGELRLLMRDSEPGGGLRVRMISDLLTGAGVQCGLIVADCCHSGGAGREFGQAIAGALVAAAGEPRARRRPDAGFVLIGAALSHEQAAQQALVRALDYALYERRLGGFTARFVDPRLVVEAAQTKLSFHDAQITGRASVPPVFPNPHRDVPADPEHFRVHFDPRARGVEVELAADRPAADAGAAAADWLFSGREAALAKVVGWLEADGPVCVVTGDPGSGKSALLGRIVTLSNPLYRARAELDGALADVPPETLPPPNAVRLALLARQQPLEVLRRMLYEGLFGELPDDGTSLGEALDSGLEQLARSQGVPVVAVDALDEATDPAAVGRELGRLAAAGRLRLLVGCRRTAVEHLGEHAAEVVDLDDADEYFEAGDVLAYAARTLSARLLADAAGGGGSAPVTNARAWELALSLAPAIAAKAGRSFLFARALAGYAAAYGLTDPATAAAALPGGLGATVDDDLAWRLHQRLDPGATPLRSLAPEQRDARLERLRRVVRDLLRPLAYARCDGLPLADVWPAIGKALARRSPDAETIDGCLGQLRPYLTETLDADGARPSYRFNHDLLVDYYRNAPPAPTGQTEARVRGNERQITDKLLELVPKGGDGRPDWLAAEPTPALRYARPHLADHAAAGGRIDAVIEDPLYLVAAEPARLAASLSSSPDALARELGDVYQRAVHKLPRAGGPVPAGARGDVAAQLVLHARQARFDRLADELSTLPPQRRFRTPWARWRRSSPHRVLEGHAGGVMAVAVGELHGRPVAVTGSHDGTARVWDLASGRPHGEPLEGHAGAVSAVAVGELHGRPVAVTGSHDGTARVWDLAAGRPHGEPLEGDAGYVEAVAVGQLDGRPVAVTGSEDGTVRVWDLAARRPHGEPLEGHAGQVLAVAVAELDGRPVAVTGSADGTARVWDLATGRPLGGPLEGHARGVAAVAVGQLDGRPVAVTGSHDGTARVWDLASGRPRGEPLEGHAGAVSAVAVGELHGRPVAVTGSWDETARVWDLAAGRPHGEPLEGDAGYVEAVAVGELHGRPVAVTGSEDGTVRVWDLAARRPHGEPLEGHDEWVLAVAVAELDGRPVAVTGSAFGTARVWDLATGRPHGEALEGHGGAVAVGELHGRPVAVTGSEDGAARVWDLATGRPHGGPLGGHAGGVGAVAVGELHGRPVAVTGSADGTARVWDLAARRPHGPPLGGHAGPVGAVAVAELDGRPVAVTGSADGTARVWDLATGRPHGPPLEGHAGPVRAVAVGQVDGRPVAVTGSADGTARVWDLAARRPHGDPLEGHAGWVWAVAVGELDGCRSPSPAPATGCGCGTWPPADRTASRSRATPPGRVATISGRSRRSTAGQRARSRWPPPAGWSSPATPA